jgi:hypothetical protein
LGGRRRGKGAEARRVYATSTLGGLVLASLDALARALYVPIGDVLLWLEGLHVRCHGGRAPRIGDVELIALGGRRG